MFSYFALTPVFRDEIRRGEFDFVGRVELIGDLQCAQTFRLLHFDDELPWRELVLSGDGHAVFFLDSFEISGRWNLLETQADFVGQYPAQIAGRIAQNRRETFDGALVEQLPQALQQFIALSVVR